MAKSGFPAAGELLSRCPVRLVVEPAEIERFDQQIRTKHYTQSARYVGQGLRYVVEADDQWVALLVFGAAALPLKARDQRIGWSARQRARRLPLVVSNVRLLLLVDCGCYRNLGSKALGLILRRRLKAGEAITLLRR